MKRALIVGAGTVVGVAAVLALNPDGATATITALPGTTTPGTTTPGSAGTSGSGVQPSSGTGASAPSSQTQTATGSAVDVGYGIVQVQATVSGGKITAIQALQLPQNDGRSAQISNQAWPMLVQQAMQAQSAQIAGISGASYTSYGFAQSLKAALVSVGHAA